MHMIGERLRNRWQAAIVESFGRRTTLFVAVCYWAILPIHAWAWPPTFGAEFNLTNAFLQAEYASLPIHMDFHTAKLMEFWQAMIREIEARCPNCNRRENSRYAGLEITFNHPDGWTFTVALDPAVIEVKMSASTAAQLRERQGEIQRLIFDAGANFDLRPQDTSGHLHIGLISAFGDDLLLYRNFIVDWIQHSAMFYEVFGGSLKNSPTLNMIGPGAVSNLRNILQQFDAQVLGLGTPQPGSILNKVFSEFSNRFVPPGLFTDLRTEESPILPLNLAIRKHVYYRSALKTDKPDKFQNLNLSHWQTIEPRCVHEASDAAEFADLAAMMEGRIAYLKTLDRPLEFEGLLRAETHQEAVDLYAKYSAQAGTSWRVAKKMMIKDLQNVVPKINCEGLMTGAVSEVRSPQP